MEESESIAETKSFADIQSDAGYSAVAIPLWYLLGDEHSDSNKYCVITNWWDYRMQDGSYDQPTLDPSLYKTRRSGTVTQGTPEEDTPEEANGTADIEFPMEAASGVSDGVNSIRI